MYSAGCNWNGGSRDRGQRSDSHSRVSRSLQDLARRFIIVGGYPTSFDSSRDRNGGSRDRGRRVAEYGDPYNYDAAVDSYQRAFDWNYDRYIDGGRDRRYLFNYVARFGSKESTDSEEK